MVKKSGRRLRFRKKKMTSYKYNSTCYFMGKTMRRNIEIRLPIYIVYDSTTLSSPSYSFLSTTTVQYAYNLFGNSNNLNNSLEFTNLATQYAFCKLNAITLRFNRWVIASLASSSAYPATFPPLFFDITGGTATVLPNYAAQSDTALCCNMVGTGTVPPSRRYKMPDFISSNSGYPIGGRKAWIATAPFEGSTSYIMSVVLGQSSYGSVTTGATSSFSIAIGDLTVEGDFTFGKNFRDG